MKICQQNPQFMAKSVEEKLEPQLCFLSSLFDLDEGGLRAMVCKFPQILSYSFDNIQSTMKFYEDLVGKLATKDYIIRNPAYLGYSLEKRLIPRLANITTLGLVVDEDIALSTFAIISNKRWEEFMDRHC